MVWNLLDTKDATLQASYLPECHAMSTGKESSTVCNNMLLPSSWSSNPWRLGWQKQDTRVKLLECLPDDITCIPENLKLHQHRRDKMKSQSSILFIRSRKWKLLNKCLTQNICNLAPIFFIMVRRSTLLFRG